MSIYKTKNNTYRVQVDMGVTFEGKRDRKTCTCKTLREARSKEMEFLLEKSVLNGKTGRVKLTYFIEEVFLPQKKQICTYETYRVYKNHLEKHVIPYIGNAMVDDIKKLHIQNVLMKCNTYRTAVNVKGTLQNVFQMAYDLEIIDRNPVRGSFQYPSKIEDKTGDELGVWLTSFDQHKQIIDAARGNRAFPLLVIGLCFGLRKGEILGLDWEQVDFDKREIRIIQTYVNGEGGPVLKTTKNRKSTRTIPMTDYAYNLLKEIRQEGGIERITGPIITLNGKRMYPQTAGKVLSRFTSENDVPRVTLLSLRHSFATACIRAGINVASVSKWLGHSDVTTTLNRYVKPIKDDLRDDVVSVIDSLYANTV